MNRFLIEHDPDSIARSLCDQHIVKMPLEEAQMLCTSLWHHAPEYAEECGLYKAVHQKHPCTLWAMENRANYHYALVLYKRMLDEYTQRYDKHHGAGKHLSALEYGMRFIPYGTGRLTPHPQCFSGHDDLKTDEIWPVEAYRAFYVVDKMRFARYDKGRKMPQWMQAHKDVLERIFNANT